MKRLADVEKLNNILRAQLILQSGIDGQLVRDAVTEYGAFLDVNTVDSVFDTVKPTDVIILFELQSRQASVNVSYTDEDGKIIYDKAYEMRVMLYGDASSNLVNTLIGRLRSEKVRTDLYNEGAYIERVSDPTEIHEFKNNIVWLRNDFTIDIGCEVEIQQVSNESNFETFDKIIIQRS